MSASRDDTSHRSMSTNERRFIRSCAMGTYDVQNPDGGGEKKDQDETAPPAAPRRIEKKGILRLDGREAGESRPVVMTFGRSHATAECSVRLGGGGDSVMSMTRAVAQVSCELLAPPNPDRPNDGVVRFTVDLSPMSSLSFEAAAPVTTGGGADGGGLLPPSEAQRLLSNRIVRMLERTILTGGAVDVEALCVRSGRFVWRLTVDVTLLDNGGNAVDACVLAAISALRHFRLPEIDFVRAATLSSNTKNDDGSDKNKEEEEDAGEPLILSDEEKEPSPLPLHHTPLTASFALFSDETGMSTAVSALVDPTDREELAMDGVLTVGYNRFGELCSLDFPGGCELRPAQLAALVDGAGKSKCLELCTMLEEALTQADEKAQRDRLERLRLANPFPSGMPAKKKEDDEAFQAFPEAEMDIPFVQRQGAMEIDNAPANDQHAAAATAAEREREYLRQALDYSVNHFPMPVREDDNDDDRKGKEGRGAPQNSLLNAMLQSAAASSSAVVPAVKPVDDSSLARKGRTKEAEEEFDRFARKAAAESTRKDKAKKTTDAMDDDDEEEAVTLQTEFSSIK